MAIAGIVIAGDVGHMKIWTGTTWRVVPVKWWDGTTWRSDRIRIRGSADWLTIQ
jgi:hypothetical protein